jgi:hypothetical protein
MVSDRVPAEADHVNNKNETAVPLHGEYAPSSAKWVRDQVEEIESSGGQRGTLLCGVPVIAVTSLGSQSGKLRKNPGDARRARWSLCRRRLQGRGS